MSVDQSATSSWAARSPAAIRLPAALLAVVVTLVAPVPAALATVSGPTDPDPDGFVRALAGEWSVVTHTVLGPGQEPIRSESRESARLVGSWLVAESVGDARGRPYTAILTLGWDPYRERFVATWIDGVQRHLWQYTGALDEAAAVLTLETEGPFMGDPSQTARYRVIMETPTPDRKVMRSQILGPDGEWFEFSRADYRRLDQPQPWMSAGPCSRGRDVAASGARPNPTGAWRHNPWRQRA